MKRKVEHTLTSRQVHEWALKMLLQLGLQPRGTQVKVTDILNVLIVAATFCTSVNQACQELKRAPCSSTVLGELARQFDDIDQLESMMNQMLAGFLPPAKKYKGRMVAIDLVDVPYHGTVDEAYQDEVRRSQAKSGTTHFFTYATAYLILKGRRYTLAMYRVRAEDTMLDVLRKMIERLHTLPVWPSFFLLDRAFYSVKVIKYLKQLHKAFIIPAVKKGKTADQPGGPTCTHALALLTTSCHRPYTLTSDTDGQVEISICVVCRNFNGRWGRHHRDTLLYATSGLEHYPPDWVRETYRTRFGIESSYRQLNQAKINTSTRNPTLRLLFYSLALLLRNLWVWVHIEVIPPKTGGPRSLQPSALRFKKMLLWLLVEAIRSLKLILHIPIDALPSDFFEHPSFLLPS